MATIVDNVLKPAKALKGQVRPSIVANYTVITGAFLADLFMGAREGRWSKRETNTNSLAAIRGAATAFKEMRTALGHAGLLEELPGYLRQYKSFGTDQVKTARTSFRPTPALLSMAAEHGVLLADLPTHFGIGQPPAPAAASLLEKRQTKAVKGARAKLLPIAPNDLRARQITGDLERLNAYLMVPGCVEGILFSGLRRVFINGDHSDFAWQWHGRYYSMPGADAYENMEGRSATRTSVVRIDGEATVEVDISAAHLTILHGLLGVPFDSSVDPYELRGVELERRPSGRSKPKALGGLVPRDDVKAWLLLALGSGDPAKGGKRHNRARDAGLVRYPFLQNLTALGIGPLDLQYHEAEIVTLAMAELMNDHGIGFLPVHDALMVAEAHRELAEAAWRNAFRRYFLEVLKMPLAPVPVIPRVVQPMEDGKIGDGFAPPLQSALVDPSAR